MVWGLLLLVCLTGLSGCAKFVAPASLIVVNGAEPESLDPHVITGQPEYRICQALGEGLTSRNGHGLIEPGLAEHWDISPNGKVYTFYLRKCQWSNGDQITTQDFVASWERALNPVLASQYCELYYPVVRAQDYSEGKIADFSLVGVKALDAERLQVTLNNPTPYFLDLCAMPTLQPVYLKGIAAWGQGWIKPGKLVSCGAYQLLDWRIEDRVSLVKNPRYWRADTVRMDRVDILAISNATTAFNLFYSGVADLILDKSMVPAFFVDQLLDKSYFHRGSTLATYFYRFNVTHKPLDDIRVRQALALSIDKQRIVERVTRAGEQIAGSMTPPGILGYQPPEGLGHDPAGARKLLAEAGFPGGSKFPVFTLLYNSSEQNEQVATSIQAMWKEELGITVQLRKQEWKVYLNTLETLDYDIARSSWIGDYCDPNTFLDMFVTGRGNNRCGWSNAGYDSLLRQIQSEPVLEHRWQLMQKAEQLLVETEVPVVPLYYYVGMALYHPGKLLGYQSNVLDEHPFREMRRQD